MLFFRLKMCIHGSVFHIAFLFELHNEIHMFVQHLSVYFSFLNSNFYLVICIFIVKALLFSQPSFLDFYFSIVIVVAGEIVVFPTENLQAWRWRFYSFCLFCCLRKQLI